MTIEIAKQMIAGAQYDFKKHIKLKRISPKQLAPVIGKSESYVRQLLNGAATGVAAEKHLRTLFDFTDYHGDFWL